MRKCRLLFFMNNVTIFAEFQFRIRYYPKMLKMVNGFNSFIVNDSGRRLNAFAPKINGEVSCFLFCFVFYILDTDRLIIPVNKIGNNRPVVIPITTLQAYYSSIKQYLGHWPKRSSCDTPSQPSWLLPVVLREGGRGHRRRY